MFMKKCTFCGTENADTTVFCELCGHRFNPTLDNETSSFGGNKESTVESRPVNEPDTAPLGSSKDTTVNEQPTKQSSEKKNCPFCNGSGKADYLVQAGFKTVLEERPCHICAGTGKLEDEAFSIISKQLDELKKQAVAGGIIRDNCPTCRGFGYAFTRSKTFGMDTISQIKCPSCTGRKITYSRKER